MFRSCPGSALHTGLAVGNCATEPEFPESAEKSATRVCRLSFSARPVGWSLLWVAVRRGFPPRTQTAVKSLAGVRRIITTSREVLSITFDRCLVLKVHLSIPLITAHELALRLQHPEQQGKTRWGCLGSCRARGTDGISRNRCGHAS